MAKKNSNPLVSIIMNCYNGEEFLNDSLKSIINQTYKNWELIFWDNKSKDSSKIIFKKFKDKRFNYYYSKKNYPLYKARKLALRKCKGNLIAFLDVDDWWHKEKLSQQVKKFNKKNIGLVYSNLFLFNARTKKYKLWSKNSLPEGSISSKLLNNYNIGLLTVMINKKILKKFNLNFNSNYKIIGDFDLFLKISKKSRILCVQQPLAYYRMHEKNFTLKNQDILVKELKNWTKENYKNYNSEEINQFKTNIEYLKIRSEINKVNFFKNLLKILKFPSLLIKIKLLLFLLIPKKILNIFA